jgi:hypothetical protein
MNCIFRETYLESRGPRCEQAIVWVPVERGDRGLDRLLDVLRNPPEGGGRELNVIKDTLFATLI